MIESNSVRDTMLPFYDRIEAGGVHVSARTTTVLKRADSGWQLLHTHTSVWVPDEEVESLQARWSR